MTERQRTSLPLDIVPQRRSGRAKLRCAALGQILPTRALVCLHREQERAGRLIKARAELGEILVGGATRDGAVERFAFAPLGDLVLKGK